jgi:hypothetical protein
METITDTTSKIEAADILFLVQCETQVAFSTMVEGKSTEVLFARYVAIIMMHEEGIPHAEIARIFKMHRTNIYYAIKTIDNLLGYNRPFKNMYLACIKRLAEMEEDLMSGEW